MKLKLLKRSLFFVSTILVLQYTYSQTLETQIDSVLTTVFKKKDEPGGVFLVAKNGESIYRKAFGKSNIELDVDMMPENVFQIGSTTKQFTAIAIMMLQEQGELNVNDAVSKFIPDYLNGNNITIHHLLTHTSGIKDFTKMKSILRIARKDMAPKELVDFFKDEPVEFKPGEKFEYNNSGYVVLGYIIELVSGETYEDFIETNIFEKLAMNNSRYASDREIVKNRAYGYHNRGAFTNKMFVSLSIPYASGSLMSTVDDMLKWQEAINNNLLISQSTIDKVFRKNTLNNGEQFTYGYGWRLKDIDGVPTREHGGSVFGFKSMGVYVPSLDIYVVGFSNCDCNSPTQATRQITALVIKKFKK
ncbi:beta-lactamase family protein [Flavobacteriaceae bacterium S0825]|uniref:serine hydrolase domain-containing protein n=1 Tax=Gaetbulibacter sp. S0825 TaxID=2720084 RepID=UPI00143102F4|nr:serine hydrolase domain-containing protein [Gaetbulibacter sp. S0825]MCK0107915.1 beta-lactamase family protein [Flavobacteriaceae bacterium S0825]NIX63551.1 beta-lactamase family protein [Gaetbulibacter sp. S0825]